MLGIVPRNQDLAKAAPNHSPDFFVDDPLSSSVCVRSPW
jgi:hypothetical protein